MSDPTYCLKCRQGDHSGHGAQDGCDNDNAFNANCACLVGLPYAGGMWEEGGGPTAHKSIHDYQEQLKAKRKRRIG